jgi:hypothetical protein
MFAEAMENSQDSTRHISESQSYTLTPVSKTEGQELMDHITLRFVYRFVLLVTTLLFHRKIQNPGQKA